jgi:signal transduction histidine kinase
MGSTAFNTGVRIGGAVFFVIKLLILFFLLGVETALAADPEMSCQLQAQTELPLASCMRVIDKADLAFPWSGLETNARMTDNLHANATQWVMLKVVNASAMARRRLLAVGLPDAFFLYVFQAQDNRLATLYSLEQNTAFRQRPVINRLIYVPLTLAANAPATLYIAYRTHGKTPLQPRLLSVEELAQQDTQQDVLNGMLFGVLLVFAAILLFSRPGLGYAESRNYVGLIVFSLLFLSQIEGYNFQFLWPGHADWNRRAPGLIVIGLVLTHAWFSLKFLQVQQRFRHLYRVFITIIGLALCSLPWSGNGYFAEWLSLLVVFYATVAVVAGILAVRQQVPAARFYLLGAISLIVFNVILMLLSVFGQNPFPTFSIFTYPKLAYLLEPGFFIIAVLKQLQGLDEQKSELRVKRQAETEMLIKAEQERLAALQTAKNQQLLLASASHDLSQPLASIRFAMDALRAREEADPVALHINKTLDYAQSLIHGLIQQACHDFDGPADRVVLFELFDRLHTEFAPAAAKKGLVLDTVSSRLEIHGSTLLLHRILANLIGNAIRYTPKGRVLVGVRRRADSIEIQVLDTGIGLFEADCLALMSPFRQGQHRDEAGYGLGLFIVKTLCQQCQYDLQVTSKLGRGSVFAVKIPLDTGNGKNIL